jgi:hypothetical protein
MLSSSCLLRIGFDSVTSFAEDLVAISFDKKARDEIIPGGKSLRSDNWNDVVCGDSILREESIAVEATMEFALATSLWIDAFFYEGCAYCCYLLRPALMGLPEGGRDESAIP